VEQELEQEEVKEPTREEKRAARKTELAEREEEQRQIDLACIDDIEVQFGDSNISVLRVPFTPNLPVLVAVRAPKGPEVKRFRARVKSDDKDQAIAAAEELGESCRVYPNKEVFEELSKLRGNLKVDCGTKALKMVVAKSADEGKD
jgi:hypothetical protein